METLKIGSEGSAVITLQTLLQKKGYAVGIDGDFGPKTEDAVEAFQRDNFMDDDGIVGKMTWDALLVVDSKADKRINTTKYVLSTSGYEPQSFAKKAIVLHHTNGWTVVKGTKDRPSMNHFAWWTSYWGTDNGRAKVATAYSIDYKGNIYQHFDPSMWAYHLGLGSRRNYMDKASIAIELVNEGYMTKEGDRFYWYSGKAAIPYNRPQDKPFYSDKKWRDYNYFAPYSDEQYDSALWLVKKLSDEYQIKKNVITDNEYHPEILDGSFEGIYTHANVRQYPSKHPKWDLSPAFPLTKFQKEL